MTGWDAVIYTMSRKEGDSWTLPVNMEGPVNSNYTETQPSLSADGKTLYFASDRPGGSGSVDLWVSHQKEDGKWTKPVNLGDTVNSSGSEMSPFYPSRWPYIVSRIRRPYRPWRL